MYYPMYKARKLELQKENILLLAEQGEPKFTDTFFPYTSGQIGNYFIQSIAIENNGVAYAKVINSMKKLISETIGAYAFDAISGGETRDWDFSNPVAVAMKKPHAKLYKNGKSLGAKIRGRNFIHVADLNNEGSSIRDFWYPQIEENGGTMTHAFFYIDRLEDGVKELEKLGLENHSVIPFDSNAWQILIDNNKIYSDVYRSLNERLEDKTAWAHNTLRNNTTHLIYLLKNPETEAKAEKILNVGYPELKEELISNMKDLGYVHDFGEK